MWVHIAREKEKPEIIRGDWNLTGHLTLSWGAAFSSPWEPDLLSSHPCREPRLKPWALITGRQPVFKSESCTGTVIAKDGGLLLLPNVNGQPCCSWSRRSRDIPRFTIASCYTTVFPSPIQYIPMVFNVRGAIKHYQLLRCKVHHTTLQQMCKNYRERMKSEKQLSQSHWNHTPLASGVQAQLYGRVFFPPNEKAVVSGHFPWTYKNADWSLESSGAPRKHYATAAPNFLGRGARSIQGSVPVGQSMIPWCCSSSFLHRLHRVLPDCNPWPCWPCQCKTKDMLGLRCQKPKS